MTREEREDAINYFKNKLENEVYGAKYNKLAIEALEQEPCEDAVSRKAVITIIQNHWWNCRDIDKLVNELPSVTPIRPKGHWIPTYGNVKCSVCGSVKDSREVGRATHYCDFCGADMRESEE